MISFCLATRGRTEAFKRFCGSVLETATSPDDIEFITYHDDDDPTVYEYIGNHKEIVGTRNKLITHMDNECFQIAQGPIYASLPDITVFETKGWDDQVKEAFEKYPDKIALVYGNDGYWKWRFAPFWFIHKNWVEAVGHYLPPHKGSQLAEKWLYDVAKMVNRLHYLPEMRITLLTGEYRNDKTHKDFLIRNKRGDFIRLYDTVEMAEERVRDAKKLKEFIENHANNRD